VSAVAESGAAPGEGLEQQLMRLRELVFRRSAEAVGYARELGRNVELLTARVELMSALADWNDGVDGARDQIERTAARLTALEPTDPQTLLDLIAALLLAGREPEAFARVLKFRDSNRQEVDYAQTMMLIEYLFGGGRVAEVEMLLQRGLRHSEAGLAGLLSTFAVTVLSGRPGAVIPANRRLLTELLGLVDRQLLSAPDDPALLRIRARSLVYLGRYRDALGAVDAIPDRDDGDASVRWLRIVVLTRLHDYQAALQDFDLLSPEQASTSWALAIRTYLLQNLGQHSRALEVGAEALQRYPDHLDVQLAYALAVDAAGEPERALELIGELLRGRPDDTELLTVDAALLRRLGRLDAATATLQHAVETNPHDVEARAALADLLTAGGHADEAISQLDAAINDDPDRADLLVQRARILLQVDRTIEALENVDLAQRGDAAGADVLGLRGDILLKLGREEEAAAWYKRAFREVGAAGSSVSEHYATSLEQIASDLFNDGTHFTEALDCLKPLTAAGVLSAAGMGMRAELLRLTGRYTQALEQADQAIAAGADHAWTSATKAQTLVDLSRSQEALDILEEVLAANPDYVWARFTAISAMGEVGRGSDSLAALDQYFPQDDAPEGWVTASQMTRARFFLDLGRYEEAISKLLSLSGEEDIADADRAYLRGVLGVAYNRLGRVDEAADELRESIKLFGDETPKWAHVELADALARRQEQLTDEATVLYRSVVTTVPPELVPRERANRAWALFRLGQVDEAIAEYQTALTAAADPLGEVRFHYVAMLYATGQPQAEAELERALATTAALPDRDQAREVLHEGRYLLDLLAHDQAHASAAEQLAHLSERLAKQDLDGITHNRAGA
jgi:tetratricopeptide (TPR) repeat protein